MGRNNWRSTGLVEFCRCPLRSLCEDIKLISSASIVFPYSCANLCDLHPLVETRRRKGSPRRHCSLYTGKGHFTSKAPASENQSSFGPIRERVNFPQLCSALRGAPSDQRENSFERGISAKLPRKQRSAKSRSIVSRPADGVFDLMIDTGLTASIKAGSINI